MLLMHMKIILGFKSNDNDFGIEIRNNVCTFDFISHSVALDKKFEHFHTSLAFF